MKGFEDINQYVLHITKEKVVEEFYFYYFIDNENIAFMYLDNYHRIIFNVKDYNIWLRTKKIKKLIK